MAKCSMESCGLFNIRAPNLAHEDGGIKVPRIRTTDHQDKSEHELILEPPSSGKAVPQNDKLVLEVWGSSSFGKVRGVLSW
jgi:hypothetical protein